MLDQSAPHPDDVIPPLDALPLDGVPIAAVRHVILAVPPISPEATVVFMLACSYAWSLEPMPTLADVEAMRAGSTDEPDVASRGLAELLDRGLATIDDAGRIQPTTGVPGSPPPPPAAEVWAELQAWLDTQT